MFEPNQHLWRVSEKKDGLGLCCADDGLFLANTSLLERHPKGFVPRSQE